MSKVPCEDCIVLGVCAGILDNSIIKLFTTVIPKCSIIKEYLTRLIDKKGPIYSNVRLNKLKIFFNYESKFVIKSDGPGYIKIFSSIMEHDTKRSSKKVRATIRIKVVV